MAACLFCYTMRQGAGMPGQQAFPQEGAYFTVPVRTCADFTAWHRKDWRRFSDLIILQLEQYTQEGMNTSPTK